MCPVKAQVAQSKICLVYKHFVRKLIFDEDFVDACYGHHEDCIIRSCRIRQMDEVSSSQQEIYQLQDVVET